MKDWNLKCPFILHLGSVCPQLKHLHCVISFGIEAYFFCTVESEMYGSNEGQKGIIGCIHCILVIFFSVRRCIYDILLLFIWNLFEPRHDKTNKVTVRPAKTDQPGHPPSLIRVFAVRMKKAWVLSYPLSAQRRL